LPKNAYKELISKKDPIKETKEIKRRASKLRA
jgi:hypothetical protein